VDNAVALVQAYLRVNGYFTVSKFPVIELREARVRNREIPEAASSESHFMPRRTRR
jgi:hypothetical protein